MKKLTIGTTKGKCDECEIKTNSKYPINISLIYTIIFTTLVNVIGDKSGSVLSGMACRL